MTSESIKKQKPLTFSDAEICLIHEVMGYVSDEAIVYTFDMDACVALKKKIAEYWDQLE